MLVFNYAKKATYPTRVGDIIDAYVMSVKAKSLWLYILDTKMLYEQKGGLISTVKNLHCDIQLYHAKNDAFRVMAFSGAESVFWFEGNQIFAPFDLVYCTKDQEIYVVCALTDPTWSAKASLIKLAKTNSQMPGIEDDRLFVAVVTNADLIEKLHTLDTFDIYAVIQSDGSLQFEAPPIIDP